MDSASIAYLDQVKTRYGLASDYALSALLGVTRSMVSAYRKKKRLLGEESALRVAALLGLDPGSVLATIAAERSQSDAARAAWLAIAARPGPMKGGRRFTDQHPRPAASPRRRRISRGTRGAMRQ